MLVLSYLSVMYRLEYMYQCIRISPTFEAKLKGSEKFEATRSEKMDLNFCTLISQRLMERRRRCVCVCRLVYVYFLIL
jgi:hypothetical protein